MAERLEPRWLMTRVALVEHEFRADDFTLNGTFDYTMRLPENYDYIDSLSKGSFSSPAGHLEWTSPKDGTAYFSGVAKGDGRSSVWYAGARRGCADYGIEETGSFNLTIDASQSLIRVDESVSTATGHTYYHDLTGSQCPASDPVTPRFFGGDTDFFTGTFDASSHTVSLSYDQPSPNVKASGRSTSLGWAARGAMDWALTIAPKSLDGRIPDGWNPVTQTAPEPSVPVIDLQRDGLELQVDVSGQLPHSGNVLQPVAKVRLFWAASATDTSGAEIPVTSDNGPLDVYWNSAGLYAVLDQFPARPAGVTHVRVVVAATGEADDRPENNTQFVRYETFQATDAAGGSSTEDEMLDAQTASVLADADRLDPEVRVYAYQPKSDLGATVQIIDDGGGYVYDPRQVPGFQALAAAETAADQIRFLAIRYQSLVDEASRTIVVTGLNDAPRAGDDSAVTTNYQSLEWEPADLLANDSDVDHNDSLTLSQVGSVSARGATIRLEPCCTSPAKVTKIIYEPATSNILRQLATGEKIEDEFTYTIVDAQGATAQGRVLVTVTGEAPITLQPVSPQLTTQGVATGIIPLILYDSDGDPSDLAISGVASDTTLMPQGSLVFGGAGSQRTLVATPASGLTGRAWITVTASDTRGRTASVRFPIIVGTLDDLDLDGVPNAEEDAAPNGGDMNRDGRLDSRQAHVASRRAQTGTAFVNLEVEDQYFFANVYPAAAPEATGPATSAEFPLGLMHYEVVLDTPGAAATVEFRTDLVGIGLNRYFQHSASGGGEWEFLMYDTAVGARVYSDRVEVTVRDDSRTDQDGARDGRAAGNAGLAHVALPWQNLEPVDINNDGNIVPLDVVLLVNRMNATGARKLGDMPAASESLPLFLDVNGSGYFEPIDVVTAVYYVNRLFARGAGEGESILAAAAPPEHVVVSPFTAWTAAALGERETGLSDTARARGTVSDALRLRAATLPSGDPPSEPSASRSATMGFQRGPRCRAVRTASGRMGNDEAGNGFTAAVDELMGREELW